MRNEVSGRWKTLWFIPLIPENTKFDEEVEYFPSGNMTNFTLD